MWDGAIIYGFPSMRNQPHHHPPFIVKGVPRIFCTSWLACKRWPREPHSSGRQSPCSHRPGFAVKAAVGGHEPAACAPNKMERNVSPPHILLDRQWFTLKVAGSLWTGDVVYHQKKYYKFSNITQTHQKPNQTIHSAPIMQIVGPASDMQFKSDSYYIYTHYMMHISQLGTVFNFRNC